MDISEVHFLLPESFAQLKFLFLRDMVTYYICGIWHAIQSLTCVALEEHFLQPESYAQDLDQADNKRGTDNNQAIAKSDNDHNSVSK